ncbi:hypothetical protein F3Y22_tig00021708pilonHSYRG00017 [Hibiscus syriacus]|uniref:Pentatricopeptide repeat-containing protein n=1 Tax=Hibiscus syriacus TaxID=106335 RepID=A0A6A3BZ72_HIBSY|nr:hypothetical protein F3Y22_tig00021708pilonHSYRG00017 [Hibiscus syriacus]
MSSVRAKSFKSDLKQSSNFHFGRPLLLAPSTVIDSTLLTASDGCRLRTCPNHRSLPSLNFSDTGTTPKDIIIAEFGVISHRLGSAREVFDDGFVLDLVSWNSMIDGYVKNGQGTWVLGKWRSRESCLKKMPFRDVISWNSMIDGYARIENVSEAHNLFDRMPERNIVYWNIMLALYVRCKKLVNHALKLINTMMERGEIRPNSASLVSVLTACATLGRLDTGLWVHSLIENNKIKCDVLLSTSLLTMYAKCGAMDLARDFLAN